jgi:deoxyribodipyrimidine photo-lyase
LTEKPALLWFRQDLRLHDHAALDAACRGGRAVVPVYVLDDAAAGAWASGGASRWWLHHSLDALSRSLAERGAVLVLRRGRAEEAIPSLAAEIGAADVFCGAAVEPWARAQEEVVHAALARAGTTLRRFRTATLFDPDRIRTKTGGVYGVYTPFSRTCLAIGPKPSLPAPERIASPRARPRSERLAGWALLPTKPDWAGGFRDTWTPGEAGALARLAAFARTHLSRYDERRNLPGEADGTSMLSPHLHWGELSAARAWHEAVHAADAGNGGLETFLRELLWREFSAYLLWHHPTLPEAPLRSEFARMPWRRDARALRAWQRGRTGIPIVDAGLRQLWHIGWMHNRVRMIVASFLIKHLLIPWQDGEAWFWDTLVDADLASNSASWQWVAGSGADAAPFFRVFNPVLQGRKFDPDGSYVRRWVPELAALDARHIHAPWEAPDGVPAGYPPPIVDLAEGRTRALAAYRTVTAGAAP